MKSNNFTQSPVAVTPKKKVAMIEVPQSTRVEQGRTPNYQFLMPPKGSETDEVQGNRVHKNNLIGLHKAKRQRNRQPKSPNLEFDKDQIYIDNKVKNILNKTINEDERLQSNKLDLQIISGSSEEKQINFRNQQSPNLRPKSLHGGSHCKPLSYGASSLEKETNGVKIARVFNSSQGTLEDSQPILQSVVDLKPKLFVNKRPIIETCRNTMSSMFTTDIEERDRKKFLVKKMSLPLNNLNNISQKDGINKNMNQI